MKISEIKAMAPEADVYALDPEARYLIVLKNTAMPMGSAAYLPKMLWEAMGIKAAVMVFHAQVEDPIQIFKDDE